MKKIVLTFGIIAGLIAAVLMAGVMVPLMHRIGFEYGMLIGYTAITASMLPVFFGIRAYRETVGGGSISFGRAFTVGILISLISCAFYIVTWEIVYFFFIPDFLDTWAAAQANTMKAQGASADAINAMMKQMSDMKVWYNNPLLNALTTLIEPLPVGILVTLISSVILRKKKPAESSGAAVPVVS
jgi:hypothetical protein